MKLTKDLRVYWSLSENTVDGKTLTYDGSYLYKASPPIFNAWSNFYSGFGKYLMKIE